MTARRPVDVQLAGTVFLDMVFTGLAGPPLPGREIRTEDMGVSPGGSANLAVALSRLGLAVRLDAGFGMDLYADYLWRTLAAEGVDLSGSRRVSGWPTPVTVSLVYPGDRAMVTFERPLEAPPPGFLETGAATARSVLAWLGPDAPGWLPAARARGVTVFADVGWDESERWASGDLGALACVDVFLPNRDEAMAYTRTSSAAAAARALAARVPLAVVKCGADGAVACRAGGAEEVHEPAIAVEAIDPTGAGDVFDAGFIFATLAGWDLGDALRFGNLCAGLSVRHHGGSLASPCWAEIDAWVRADLRSSERYAFLQPWLGQAAKGPLPTRAKATI
ncbi:MAG: PfkB family carbohydrate kinase [Chloroflexi bacterium]|jgi:sugar/nucleoside kinase (ribokinase family)|nr:PfkB family carbohydrate kinase [Chloroflexota bacterium]